MRVALLSTCAVATPPKAYGGTELVVAELAKGLRFLGHDVTVYATGDSTTNPRRYHFETPMWPPSELCEMRHAAFAWRDIVQEGYDVVHCNHAAALPPTLFSGKPAVLTLHHERVEALVDFYLDFPDVDYVAISERQRILSPEVHVQDVIHHGLDPLAYPKGDGAGGYVAFLGRFAIEKGPHLAIDAARAANMRLCMGGEPHELSRAFFTAEVAPRIAASRGLVDWRGELGHESKVALLRDASALVFPIGWEEPFGLVMIESMLVGTPVVALARGSTLEVVEEGVTGFVVKTEEELVGAIARAATLDREQCRARARERWSHLRMARDYVRVYEAAVERRRSAKPPPTRRHDRAAVVH